MEFSAMKMLYATHVIEGKRTIESVPKILREDVAKIVDEAKSRRKHLIGYVAAGAIGLMVGCFLFRESRCHMFSWGKSE